jgi:molybdopterin converting factor small subunit
MIEVRLYGLLRAMVEGSKADEDTIMYCEFKEGETFSEFLGRLELEKKDLGDCFINGNLAKPDDILHTGDRVGLFPFNMALIDGGMHLKYHPHRR